MSMHCCLIFLQLAVGMDEFALLKKELMFAEIKLQTIEDEAAAEIEKLEFVIFIGLLILLALSCIMHIARLLPVAMRYMERS